MLTRYAHIQLIVLFVLPGAIMTIFRTFLCDKALSRTRAWHSSKPTSRCRASHPSTSSSKCSPSLAFCCTRSASTLYAGLLFRARDAIQHRDGAGAEHLSFSSAATHSSTSRVRCRR